MKKTGVILLIIGALITVITGLNLTFSTQEKIVDVGDLQINARQKHRLSWSPLVGIAIMAVGGGAYLLGSKRSLLS
jgi:uncharacterized membrane protein YiaA